MAIVVVSDDSPIRALHHLGLLSLCPRLYGKVLVPEAVREELRRSTATCKPIEIGDHEGFQVCVASSTSSSHVLPADLDAGETEAITLALELKADLLLMDERTEVVRRLGLSTVGVFGLLLDAKRHGLVERVLPCVDRLVTEMRFFVSQHLRDRLARLAGE